MAAPACAARHISGFGTAEATQNLGMRLNWEIQAKDITLQSNPTLLIAVSRQ